jgi:hypothetical protein
VELYAPPPLSSSFPLCPPSTSDRLVWRLSWCPCSTGLATRSQNATLLEKFEQVIGNQCNRQPFSRRKYPLFDLRSQTLFPAHFPARLLTPLSVRNSTTGQVLAASASLVCPACPACRTRLRVGNVHQKSYLPLFGQRAGIGSQLRKVVQAQAGRSETALRLVSGVEISQSRASVLSVLSDSVRQT